MAPTTLLIVLFMVIIAISSAESDILENSGFESPPTDITTDSATPFLLSKTNTIPGWSFTGTIWYITSGPNISLPGNGHGVLLGKGGKINQTFVKNDQYVEYVVTFTLAARYEECSNISIGVKVSSPHKSSVFFFKGGIYGRDAWESHAFGLGRWVDDLPDASIEFESISENVDENRGVSCWPVLDTVVLTRIAGLNNDDYVVNGGFEIGPTFIANSSNGILLDEEPSDQDSAVQEWRATGIVKYINSKHYSIPKGKAAIQLLAGSPSAIKTTRGLSKGAKYTLGFIIGNANDSCVSEFVIYVQAGIVKQKFTLQSNGTGSAQQYYMTFTAVAVVNVIGFERFNESQTSDGVFCGPVIDRVTLRGSPFSLGDSNAWSLKLQNNVSVLCLFLTLVILRFPNFFP